jgi:hypothetical protein
MKEIEWDVLNPLTDYSRLCIGLLTILCALYVIFRVHKGSQSDFVYTIMAFSILFGVA